MRLIKCPNCRLCVDFEISFEKDLCPMCGMPFDYSFDKKSVNIDKKF
ncbi:MAG: hypothetical protein ACFFDF_07855 [Candidatus Odinarchaeota archaeon]